MTYTHTNTTYVEICVDCAYASSNGFDSEFPDGFQESYLASAKELNAEPSVVCGENDYPCGFFSHDSCDFCGSHYGGTRHTAVLIYKD